MKKHKVKGPYEAFIKRLLDILISLAVMVLFCWLYAIIAVLVRIRLGSPVIFAQNRPGMIDPETGKEKIFKLYKFRSMIDKRDENGELLPGKDRMTPFGTKLRATSLDELPEIWNIFRGDMSLIGPRPLAVIYLPYYTDEERVRHTVKPGLTGLAQVSGSNNLTWEEKFAYDIEYVKKPTFWGDLKIIYKTVMQVLKHENVAADTSEEGNLATIRSQEESSK